LNFAKSCEAQFSIRSARQQINRPLGKKRDPTYPTKHIAYLSTLSLYAKSWRGPLALGFVTRKEMPPVPRR
jgi:hypothetical protein